MNKNKFENEIISEDELTDMFGEGGKEEVKEDYEKQIKDILRSYRKQFKN